MWTTLNSTGNRTNPEPDDTAASSAIRPALMQRLDMRKAQSRSKYHEELMMHEPRYSQLNQLAAITD